MSERHASAQRQSEAFLEIRSVDIFATAHSVNWTIVLRPKMAWPERAQKDLADVRLHRPIKTVREK